MVLLLLAGSEDGQFTYLNGEGVEHSDKSKEWEPTLASVSEQSHSGEPKAWAVNKSTQTEWPQSPESVFLLPAPLSPCPSPLTPCPSPVPVRKRAYAKWENRASTVKPTYEQLEMVILFSYCKCNLKLTFCIMYVTALTGFNFLRVSYPTTVFFIILYC